MTGGTTAALEARGVEKTYAGGVRALRGIDLDVAPGDFFALLGPNGAGKSTMIGILASLVTKSAGTVRIQGHDIDTDLALAKRCLGIVPQEINLNQFEKPWDILIQAAGYYGIPPRRAKANVERYLRQLGLWEKRDVQARTLSGGMRRRLMVARALVHEPAVLVLDEPTAGVDIELRRSMWDFLTDLNDQGVTIILTTHYLEEAEQLCRNVAIIDHGTILRHAPMKTLLAELDETVYVLDLAAPVDECRLAPELRARLIDPTTVEIVLPRAASLNGVFAHCNDAGVEVRAIRPKSNRLEELFVSLVAPSGAGAGAAHGTDAVAGGAR